MLVEVSAVCTTRAEYVGVSFEEECPAQREVSLYIYIYAHFPSVCDVFICTVHTSTLVVEVDSFN